MGAVSRPQGGRAYPQRGLAPHHLVTAPLVAVRPPSTTYCAPVIAEASTGTRQCWRSRWVSRSARSGWPSDITGPTLAGSAGLSCASSEWIIRVSTGPGQTAFTRVPRRATGRGIKRQFARRQFRRARSARLTGEICAIRGPRQFAGEIVISR